MRQGNMPSAKGVLGGPARRASQTKRLVSEMGPAVIPSGGEEVRARYSENRRRDARVVDIVAEGECLEAPRR